MNKKLNALVIGVSSYDTLIYLNDFPKLKDDMAVFPEKVYKTVGGTGAGKAMALSILGAQTTLVTDLGDDSYKVNILRHLFHYPIKVIPLKADKTTTHTNIMHHQGKRMSIFTQVGNHISYNPQVEDMIKKADLIYLNIHAYALEYLPIIIQYNKPVFVDIHDYDEGNPYHQPFIECANYLMVSGVNIPNKVAFLKKKHKNHDLVILTDSEHGSHVMDKAGHYFKEPAKKVQHYVDSNGAGDAYGAAFMIAYLKTKNIQESMRFASIAGSLACESHELYPLDGTLDFIKSKD